MRGVLFVRGNAYFGEVAPAVHSRKKSEMVSALAELDTNDEFWPVILSRISDGEFVSTIAEELKVNHSILRNWIRGNKGREQALAEAMQEGKKHRIQQVLRKTYDTATAEVTEPATRMEQLRAAEIMLKQQDALADKPATFRDLTINFVQAKEGRTVEGEVIDSVP